MQLRSVSYLLLGLTTALFAAGLHCGLLFVPAAVFILFAVDAKDWKEPWE